MGLNIERCLALMTEQKASDLHLKVGIPPVVRKMQLLQFLESGGAPVTQEDLTAALENMFTEDQKKALALEKQTDFSYGVKGLGRFRFNVCFQRGTLRAVIRHIPTAIPTFEKLNLPVKIKHLVNNPIHGLILVTGATGMGKSSTIAAMLNTINQTKNRHIITVEDPIEFLITDRKSLITQRELGTDYNNYTSALKAALRQDPDIIFFGEIRDSLSLETALSAANAGHLVFSSLHTNNAVETITRILAFFAGDKIAQKRKEFASVLRAIISQRLVVRKSGGGLVPAVEILINNPRIREILEDVDKSPSILTEIIETGKDVWNMQSFNQHLIELYDKGVISKKSAVSASDSPEKLQLHFSGLTHDNKHRSASGKEIQGLKTASKLDLAPLPEPVSTPKRLKKPAAKQHKKKTWKAVF